MWAASYAVVTKTRQTVNEPLSRLADWLSACRSWCVTTSSCAFVEFCSLPAWPGSPRISAIDRRTPYCLGLYPPQRAERVHTTCLLQILILIADWDPHPARPPQRPRPSHVSPQSCPALPCSASCAPRNCDSLSRAMYAGNYGYPNNAAAGSPPFNGNAPPPVSQNSAMQPGTAPSQMMYNSQPFPMGAQSSGAFPPNSNMMAGVGPAGMMQNTGMPHMPAGNGQSKPNPVPSRLVSTTQSIPPVSKSFVIFLLLASDVSVMFLAGGSRLGF